MLRALIAVTLLLACVACDRGPETSPSGGPGGSGVGVSDFDKIDSTLDSIESDLAGDK